VIAEIRKKSKKFSGN
jgi:P-loop containing dynein motor region D4